MSVKFFKQKKGAPIAARPEVHRCQECGSTAAFGFGVRVRLNQPGRWFCGKHKHLGEQAERRSAA